MARQPAQPGRPACVWPAATRSNDSGGQTRVSNLQTRPHASRLSVFRFKTRNTWLEPNPLPFRRIITNFKPNQARFGPDPSRFGEISLLFDEIWARSCRIRLDFGPGDKTRDRLESIRNWRELKPKIRPDLRVGFGSNFHPSASIGLSSGWAQTRLGPNHGQL